MVAARATGIAVWFSLGSDVCKQRPGSRVPICCWAFQEAPGVQHLLQQLMMQGLKQLLQALSCLR